MPRFPALPCPHARPQARFLGRPLPRPRSLPAQPTNPAPAHASFCCCRCRCSCPCPCPCPWALPFPHCAFPSGSRAPFPHVHSIHVPSRSSVSPRFSHLRHVPKLNLTPPRTCVLCPTGKQHLILACLCGIWGPSCPSFSCPVTTAALGSPRAHPASRLADTLPSPSSMTSECSVPCCPVRVPPCECGVRVSVQVSVGWLCARLVLPSLVNFWRPSPSQVQVRSNQEEPSRVAPISLLASSPLRPQYPFLHTIKANLTPPQAFPFPSIKGPGLGRFSQPGLDPSAKLNSQGAYCAYLDSLDPPTASSSCLLILPLPTGCPRPRPRLCPPPPLLLLPPPPSRLAQTEPVPLPGPVSCAALPCPIRPIYSTRRVRITELVTAFGC